ncbi:hypothetical protein [Flavobacterium sp.]|uniref:hypothetical protein n=1 Tax=Flavobacterium sp. TaxID=239 RepID=UPI000E980ED0|nr:hypothetical protein [Flavobacterium sp.]HBD27307.1 hypothetical protein [Flavobacterium sp.]
MKLKTKIIIGISLTLFLFFSYIGYGLYLMSIEDKYGDFQELYSEINKSDNYFVIIDYKQVGFIKKLEGEIYIAIDDNLKHLLNYSNNNIEVYKFEVNETYSSFSLKDAVQLKKEKSTELIYKN